MQPLSASPLEISSKMPRPGLGHLCLTSYGARDLKPALAPAGAGFFEDFASPFRWLIGGLVNLYLVGLVTQSSFHGSEIVTPSVCTKAGGVFCFFTPRC